MMHHRFFWQFDFCNTKEAEKGRSRMGRMLWKRQCPTKLAARQYVVDHLHTFEVPTGYQNEFVVEADLGRDGLMSSCVHGRTTCTLRCSSRVTLYS